MKILLAAMFLTVGCTRLSPTFVGADDLSNVDGGSSPDGLPSSDAKPAGGDLAQLQADGGGPPSPDGGGRAPDLLPACGAAGGDCCGSGPACGDPSLTCTSCGVACGNRRVCSPCGHAGQPCCENFDADGGAGGPLYCTDGTSCGALHYCGCGGTGQACCPAPSAPCASGNPCDNSVSGGVCW